MLGLTQIQANKPRMNTLYLKVREADVHTPIVWFLVRENDEVEQGTDLLEHLTSKLQELAVDLSSDLETVLLIPDQDVLLVAVDVPSRSSSRTRRAAPFAVEPFLTEDLEVVHVAVGEIRRGQPTLCGAINKDLLRQYLSLFQDTNFRPKIATTLGLLLEDPNGLVVLEGETGVTVRTPRHLLDLSDESLLTVFQSALASVEGLSTVTYVHASEIDSPALRKLIDKVPDDVTQVHVTIADALRDRPEKNRHLNFCQGDFAVEDKQTNLRRNFRVAATTVLVSVFVLVTLNVVTGLWAGYQRALLEEEALDLFESAFDTREVVGNPVFRMRERLGASERETGSWLPLMTQIANANDDIDITNLEYVAGRNELNLTFYSDDFGSFEEFKRMLEESRLVVDVNVAEQQENSVWVRLTVTPA